MKQIVGDHFIRADGFLRDACMLGCEGTEEANQSL
jgi:hypothetical protein